MQQTLEMLPGVTLRCMQDSRFKQSAMSIQLLRPMDASEAALNALLPAILLRGCRDYPDLQQITQRLDDLYGASVGTLVRRIGDYQTTGFYCGFMEDRFALPGDEILAPMIRFAMQLLLDPVMEDGGFSRDFAIAFATCTSISLYASFRTGGRCGDHLVVVGIYGVGGGVGVAIGAFTADGDHIAVDHVFRERWGRIGADILTPNL